MRRRAFPAGRRLIGCAVLLFAAGTVVFTAVPIRLVRNARHAFAGIERLHWGFVPALVALSGLHYLLAAVALRASAGARPPLGRTTLVQFTAAAANRVSPGGLGAAAINVRYLTGHGLPPVRAVAAVAALQVTGALADVALSALVLVMAGFVADGAPMKVVGARGAELTASLPSMTTVPVLLVSLVLVAFGIIGWRFRDRLSRSAREVAQLLRRPGDLLLVAAASAGTTLVMGVAFVLSLLAVPAATAPGEAVTLLVIYLVGAAAAAVVPSPGGVGSTEAALIALLVLTGVPVAGAIQGVTLFRLVTFWAPVPVGLIAARTALTGSAAAAVSET